MPKTFLIFGPPDHNSLPQFWSRDLWQWVDRDGATLYTEAEAFAFPPRELPVGGVGIIDIETHKVYTPSLGFMGGHFREN
jgi:hypothetical protein